MYAYATLTCQGSSTRTRTASHGTDLRVTVSRRGTGMYLAVRDGSVPTAAGQIRPAAGTPPDAYAVLKVSLSAASRCWGSIRRADRVAKSTGDLGRWVLVCVGIDTDQCPTACQSIHDHRAAIASAESRPEDVARGGFFACTTQSFVYANSSSVFVGPGRREHLGPGTPRPHSCSRRLRECGPPARWLGAYRSDRIRDNTPATQAIERARRPLAASAVPVSTVPVLRISDCR